MSICCCSLAGTKACDTCPNGPGEPPKPQSGVYTDMDSLKVEGYERGRAIEKAKALEVMEGLATKLDNSVARDVWLRLSGVAEGFRRAVGDVRDAIKAYRGK